MESKLKINLFTLFFSFLSLLSYGKDFVITNYGAIGDGKTDDAEAVQKAIDACSVAGGGRVCFPANKIYLTGPVKLQSNIHIYLMGNAVWRANPDKNVYHLSPFGKNEGEGMMWIYARNASNITISGDGSIDGNGIAFMGKEQADSYDLLPVTTFDPRPHVLTLIGVDHLSIRNVTIREGAYWTVHLAGCNDVVIDGVRILNNLKIRNGDGIDIDHSRNVRIANCHITSGDDCICLKNRREFAEYGACKDIVVTNCIMTSRSCAIKIGSENMDSISNVLFDNCIIRASNRGLGIQDRDEGTVTNVVFSNIILDCRLWSDVWWGKAEPIYVTSYPRANGNNKDANWRFPKGQTMGCSGEVSYIYFNNIYATTENGCFIGGDTIDKVNHVYLNGVHLNLRKITPWPGGVYDRRPCREEEFIHSKVYGLYIDKTKDVYIKDLEVQHQNIDYGGDVFPESINN